MSSAGIRRANATRQRRGVLYYDGPAAGIRTVFLGQLGLFLASFHLHLVRLEVDGLEDGFGDFLLPPLRHRQRKVLIQLLVGLRQLQPPSTRIIETPDFRANEKIDTRAYSANVGGDTI